jgi:hypothetical protein
MAPLDSWSSIAIVPSAGFTPKRSTNVFPSSDILPESVTGRISSGQENDKKRNYIPVDLRCFPETLRAQATADRERRFWQPSRHAEAIQTERFWQQKLDCLHDNPRRKGLVRHPRDWRWSCAAWYFTDGQQAIDVPLTRIAW